jgi:hypothetical protein
MTLPLTMIAGAIGLEVEAIDVEPESVRATVAIVLDEARRCGADVLERCEGCTPIRLSLIGGITKIALEVRSEDRSAKAKISTPPGDADWPEVRRAVLSVLTPVAGPESATGPDLDSSLFAWTLLGLGSLAGSVAIASGAVALDARRDLSRAPRFDGAIDPVVDRYGASSIISLTAVAVAGLSFAVMATLLLFDSSGPGPARPVHPTSLAFGSLRAPLAN